VPAALPITLACGPYDRMAAIFDGRVAVEGATVRGLPIVQPMVVFSRMLEGDEFDVAEMSLTHCFALQANGTARFVTLPIFPSRMFRHGFVFVNANAGIRSPRDLAGKRIGVQGYQMTAAVWQRGMLREEHGVDFTACTWFEGGVNEPGVVGGSATSLRPADHLNISAIPGDRTLSDMLRAGEIDALIGAVKPASYAPGGPVVRLFPDFHAIERASFLATNVHPIMHALVIRRDTYERAPWLAASLIRACEEAKRIALAEMRFTASLRYMLPWLVEDIEEIDAVFGGDPWPYGLAANAPTLEAFGRHLTADGFLSAPSPMGDVFVEAIPA
jgi:4,5-dihydroxyphthalate decarboxylase